MTKALDAELALHNQAVDAAVANRKAWMDGHMKDYAKFQVGDEIYERESGRKLGVVTELYRYWGTNNALYDTSMSIEYKFSADGRYIDNTSSRGSYTRWKFATREEAAEYQRQQYERLKSG